MAGVLRPSAPGVVRHFVSVGLRELAER